MSNNWHPRLQANTEYLSWSHSLIRILHKYIKNIARSNWLTVTPDFVLSYFAHLTLLSLNKVVGPVSHKNITWNSDSNIPGCLAHPQISQVSHPSSSRLAGLVIYFPMKNALVTRTIQIQHKLCDNCKYYVRWQSPNSSQAMQQMPRGQMEERLGGQWCSENNSEWVQLHKGDQVYPWTYDEKSKIITCEALIPISLYLTLQIAICFISYILCSTKNIAKHRQLSVSYNFWLSMHVETKIIVVCITSNTNRTTAFWDTRNWKGLTYNSEPFRVFFLDEQTKIFTFVLLLSTTKNLNNMCIQYKFKCIHEENKIIAERTYRS